MSNQLKLFEERILTDHIVRIEKWEEFYENGEHWITGDLVLVKEEYKHLYDYRVSYTGFEGKPVVRIGVWRKYFDNGQLAWQLDYGDGRWESNIRREELKSWRKDGTPIVM